MAQEKQSGHRQRRAWSLIGRRQVQRALMQSATCGATLRALHVRWKRFLGGRELLQGWHGSGSRWLSAIAVQGLFRVHQVWVHASTCLPDG